MFKNKLLLKQYLPMSLKVAIEHVPTKTAYSRVTLISKFILALVNADATYRQNKQMYFHPLFSLLLISTHLNRTVIKHVNLSIVRNLRISITLKKLDNKLILAKL